MRAKKSPARTELNQTSFTNNYSIPTIDVSNLKAAINPAEFYQSRNATMPATNRNGWVGGGLCPFHLDNKPGSYRINTETGAFKCFSCGTKGGDVIAWTMERDDLSFQDALQKLADEYGIKGHAISGKKKPFTAREALLTLEKEALILNLAAADVVNGKPFSESDFERVKFARDRIQTVCREVFNA